MRWRVRRGSYLSLFLITTSQGFELRGSFLHPRPHGRLGGSPSPLPLPPCPQPFTVGTVGLSPHHILR
jgi:hypothetical protein